MSQQELLKKVATVLDRAGIAYMLTGSMASSLQGEPRSTHDIDFVVAIQPEHAGELLNAFPLPDFYLDRSAIEAAITNAGMFNLVSVLEGDKVDFWVLTNEPFDQSRFQRRRHEDFLGMTIRVSSPEDTILMKLRWAEMSGGSEKQFGDALHVYEVQTPNLDIDYIKRWVAPLGVAALWDRLLAEAKP